jgi:hypothetical protein
VADSAAPVVVRTGGRFGRPATRRFRAAGTAQRRRSVATPTDNVIEKRFNAVEKIRSEALSKREAGVSAATAEKFFGVSM